MLAVRVELLRGVFEGGHADDPQIPEWPPSWMRVFSAFVDAAAVDDRWGILEQLEDEGPPVVRMSKEHRNVRGAYVPTNKAAPGKNTATLLERIGQERWWARSIPRIPLIEYVWGETEWSEGEIAELRVLARRIPYIGRSTSSAIVTCNDQESSHDLMSLVPYRDVDPSVFDAETAMRVPFKGSVAALRRSYESKKSGKGGDPWEVGVWEDYGTLLTSEVKPEASTVEETVVLKIIGSYLDGRNTAAITRYVRMALMSRVGDPSVAALHGHKETNQNQRVMVVGLPDVGHPHADGHLMGVGILLPELSRRDLIRVAAALPAVGEIMDVKAGRLGVLHLERITPSTESRMPYGLRTSRWTRPSARWSTVLPMVAERFIKPGDLIFDEVARMVDHAGLPRLKKLETWSKRPLIEGGVDLRPQDTLRKRGDRARKPYFHATIELAESVYGPVVLGSMRTYGLGLCVPNFDDLEQERA